MTITRMQEPRQMYQQGGIMQVAPRQGYFLGKLVKSIGKGVKKIVKSPIGKAALLIGGAGLAGFGPAAGLRGSALGQALFGGATKFLPGATAAMKGAAVTTPGIFGKAASMFGNLSTGTKLGLGGAFASYLMSTGASEEEVEEIKRDKGKLSIYLKDYFTKLNPNASDEEVDEFVTTNTSEYAVGGRVGFSDGKNMKMASAPDPADSLNDLSQMLFGKNLDELTDEEYDALQEKARDTLAVGGRVGFADGSYTFEQFMQDKSNVDKFMNQEQLKKLYEKMMKQKEVREQKQMAADGGRIGYQEGSKEPVAKKTMPLLDMGGKEMDLRDDGGFVPIGRMEKADDVPARLSKNEFVFTADAVRNAGEGDVDKGAEVMYNMMKNLESGGEVSEESQGLEGAREMFQTSKRLEEVL